VTGGYNAGQGQARQGGFNPGQGKVNFNQGPSAQGNLTPDREPDSNEATVPKQYGSQVSNTTTEPPDLDDPDPDIDDDIEKLRIVMQTVRQLSSIMMMGIEIADGKTDERTIRAHTKYYDVLAYLARNDPRLFAMTDDGDNTLVTGKGWPDLATARYANLVWFDKKATRKSGLPIVTGITKVKVA
jgi:hypothetical protein